PICCAVLNSPDAPPAASNCCSTSSWTAWRGALPPADRNRPEVAGPRWYFHRADRLIPNEGHVVGQIAADSRRPGARRSISRRWDVVTYEGRGYGGEGNRHEADQDDQEASPG